MGLTDVAKVRMRAALHHRPAPRAPVHAPALASARAAPEARPRRHWSISRCVKMPWKETQILAGGRQLSHSIMALNSNMLLRS